MAEARKVIPIQSAVDDDAGLFSLYAAHRKIYPRAVTGLFAKLRWAAVVFTQLIFYGLPWLTWNGRQAVLFDLQARKFYLFGVVLWPQDFIYLAGLLVVAALSLFFFTAVAGRLWCGYACPQTVYTELFMWIERHVEGDRNVRMKLDASPWSFRKLRIKASKHALWLALALFTGFTFIGYFAPIRELGSQAFAFALGPWQWFWGLFYSFATWGNAGFMREQVCKYMCPYARFQGAMFDKDTMIVTYDAERGEPRGSRPKKADPKAAGLGACVDCTLCVQVCPTGIDIRNGLQYECIGCAACIDVCDDVMDKMGYAKGLIRYSTENGVVNGWTRMQMFKRALRPRVLIYGAVLCAVSVAFAASVAMRSPFKFDVVKDRGTLGRVIEDGTVENVYRIQIMNRTEEAQTYRISASGIDGLDVLAVSASAGPAAVASISVSLRLPYAIAQGFTGRSMPVLFEVRGVEPAGATHAAKSAMQFEKSTFFVPR